MTKPAIAAFHRRRPHLDPSHVVGLKCSWVVVLVRVGQVKHHAHLAVLQAGQQSNNTGQIGLMQGCASSYCVCVGGWTEQAPCPPGRSASRTTRYVTHIAQGSCPHASSAAPAAAGTSSTMLLSSEMWPQAAALCQLSLPQPLLPVALPFLVLLLRQQCCFGMLLQNTLAHVSFATILWCANTCMCASIHRYVVNPLAHWILFCDLVVRRRECRQRVPLATSQLLHEMIPVIVAQWYLCSRTTRTVGCSCSSPTCVVHAYCWCLQEMLNR
jgi:hypothetical protein